MTYKTLAVRTGLEPATSAVTGRHSNQLNYRTNTISFDLGLQIYNYFIYTQIFFQKNKYKLEPQSQIVVNAPTKY